MRRCLESWYRTRDYTLSVSFEALNPQWQVGLSDGKSIHLAEAYSVSNMAITDRLLKYFNRKKSESTEKNHTRFRNDICNHWDLDYMSLDEIDKRLQGDNLETTVARKKKD